MGVVASLNNDNVSFDNGNDTIVVPLVLETVIGGRTLDTTGYTPETIKAGSVVIKEDSTGNHKPMPLKVGEKEYTDSIPSGHSFVGVLISTIEKKKPFAGISVRGNCNEVASPYPPTTAIKEALPRINFFRE